MTGGVTRFGDATYLHWLLGDINMISIKAYLSFMEPKPQTIVYNRHFLCTIDFNGKIHINYKASITRNTLMETNTWIYANTTKESGSIPGPDQTVIKIDHGK